MAHRSPADCKEQWDKEQQPRAPGPNKAPHTMGLQHTGSPGPRTERVLETRRVGPPMVMRAIAVSKRRQRRKKAKASVMTAPKVDALLASSRRLGARNRVSPAFGRVRKHSNE